MLTKGQRTSNYRSCDWVVLSEPSPLERTKLINAYALPLSFFDLQEEKIMASLQSSTTPLNEAAIILHIPLWTEQSFSRLEAASRSLTSYVAPNVVMVWTDRDDHAQAVSKMNQDVDGLAYVFQKIMEEQTRIATVLDALEKRIAEVENQTKARANRDVLLQLTNLEQEVVIVSSRLDNYDDSLSRFLSHPLVERNLTTNSREQIRLAVKKAHYRIHLYKDLVESTSGLLSDSIDNKLNTIMEYLQTWALVISIPTLVFSLFGINTSGMIGRETPFGSWIVIGTALLLGAVTAWWLRKKEFK